MGKDSGPAPAPTSTSTSQTTIPEYARPYVERMLGKTEALTSTPYQTYGGQRLTGFNPLQMKAFADAASMGPSAATARGIDYAGLGTLGAFGAGKDYMSMATSPGAVSSFMSPYMQDVVNAQKAEAERDYSKMGTQLAGQASRQGAFGGSRAAIEQAENRRNLGTKLSDIQATGSQKAYEDALKNMQYGSALGLQGIQTGLQGAGLLGTLGGQQFQQGMDINKLQQQVGGVQQAATQQGLDLAYQDFLKQQNYPYTQLSFFSDMLRGLPLSQSSQQIYSAPPSMTSQLAGLGLAGAGMYGMMKKEGGAIKSYAAGGIATGVEPNKLAAMLDRMSDQQLDTMLRNPETDNVTKEMVVAEMKSRQQMRAGSAGLAAAPSGMSEDSFAGGGILAFADGGDTDEDEEDQILAEEGMLSSILKNSVAEQPQGISIAKRETSVGVNPESKGLGIKAIADKTAEKYGLDPEYVSKIIAKETGGAKDPARAVSSAGAQGIMQLMPGTAKDMGVKDAFDPAQNIEGGVKYLAMLNKRYDDPTIAAIAYNWGPGNTDKWLKAGGDIKKLPKETRQYIASLAKGGAVGYAAGDIVKSLSQGEEIVDMPETGGFDRYMENLLKQRQRLAESAAQDKNMALITAGLGMAGETSPHALSNIAKGGMKGIESYGAASKARAAEELGISKAELGGLRAKELEEYRKERLKAQSGNKESDLFNTTLSRINADPRVKSLEKQREKSLAEPGTPEYEYFDNAIEAIRDAYFKEAGIKNPRVRVQMPKAPAKKAEEPSWWDNLFGSSKPSSGGTMKFDKQGNPI